MIFSTSWLVSCSGGSSIGQVITFISGLGLMVDRVIHGGGRDVGSMVHVWSFVWVSLLGLILFLYGVGEFLLIVVKLVDEMLIWFGSFSFPFYIGEGLLHPPLIFLHQVGTNNSHWSGHSRMTMHQNIQVLLPHLLNPPIGLIKVHMDGIVKSIPHIYCFLHHSIHPDI